MNPISKSKWLCFMLGFCMWFPENRAQRQSLTEVFEWSQLEFDYLTPQLRQHDIDTKNFIPGVPAPVDVDVYYSVKNDRVTRDTNGLNYYYSSEEDSVSVSLPDSNELHDPFPLKKKCVEKIPGSNNNNKIFVTIPRFQSGIPVSLGVVTQKRLNGNPVITPYPSWRWFQNSESCPVDRIVSVYRVQIDECGRLWVLDNGRLVDSQVCPPQILAFDLQTNELIHRYEIPSSQLESRSILVTLMVDVRDPHLKCRDTFVYVADCQTYSIIVYDVKRSTSWLVTDKTMYPYPNYGTFYISGDQFELMDGILGMALSPYRPGEDRRLFYHAMSGPTENWVYTSLLRNQTMFLHDPESSPQIFHTYQGLRPSQSAAQAIDRNGIAYFGLLHEVSVNCWNTATEYGKRNFDVVDGNPVTMQFASGIKVINNKRDSQELWVVTSRLQKIFAGNLNPTETNFRIQAGKIDNLLKHSKCLTVAQNPHNGGTGGGFGWRPHPGGSYGKASEKRSAFFFAE